MTLSGGDPDALTLRHFLDAAVALFVDEYTKPPTSMTMFDATDLMHPWAAGDGDEVTPTVSGSTADSLSQLNAMMKDIR